MCEILNLVGKTLQIYLIINKKYSKIVLSESKISGATILLITPTHKP